MRKWLLALVALPLLATAAYVGSAAHPELRAKRLFFAGPVAGVQRVAGLPPVAADRFAWEDPAVLRPLRERGDLDAVIAGAPTDFDAWVRLMHWVRDRFPHGQPPTRQDPQRFDGAALLAAERGQGYLCSTAAQLLIQAITAVGGHARRVDLRFTPEDAHVVVEAWSDDLGKWVVLDPDYDVWFTVDGVPQHALELHARWAANDVDAVTVHWRPSPHNIYRADAEAADGSVIRAIYESGDWGRWDRERRAHKDARFAVKLLHYYSQVSHPLRNDWLTRPLPWWHPDGNHVQDSLVVLLPTMRRDEDFLLETTSPDVLYAPPVGARAAGGAAPAPR